MPTLIDAGPGKGAGAPYISRQGEWKDVPVDVTAGDAYNGAIYQLGDGRLGILTPLNSSLGGEMTLRDIGAYRAVKSSGTDFVEGQPVWWNSTTHKAVDTATGYYLGVCREDTATGSTWVTFNLNQGLALGYYTQPTPHTFAHGDGSGKVDMLLAASNAAGCVITSGWGIVKTHMAGGDEDQMIITIYDSDNNAIGTITCANGGAAAGSVAWMTTPALTIPAGKGIKAAITQDTSGGGAGGATRIYLTVSPL